MISPAVREASVTDGKLKVISIGVSGEAKVREVSFAVNVVPSTRTVPMAVTVWEQLVYQSTSRTVIVGPVTNRS